jgi:hypothetical protein
MPAATSQATVLRPQASGPKPSRLPTLARCGEILRLSAGNREELWTSGWSKIADLSNTA